MSPSQLATLHDLPNFPAFGRELVRVAGLTAAARLISEWGGQEFRVPAVVGGGSPKGERRWAQLSEIAGEEAAGRMVRAWPGEIIYIPLCEAARGRALEDKLKNEYDELTGPGRYSHRDAVFELGVKYRKNYRSIERLVNRPASAPAKTHGPEQLPLDFAPGMG
jgi:hypothetical protein